jgi:hypothetical protein
MGFILHIIVWILTPVFELGNLITVLFVYAKKRGFLRVLNGFLYSASHDKDCFANHNYRTGLNFWLSSGGYEFGNKNETMSSVLGKKSIEKSLNFCGWVWYYSLYIIDFSNWKKGGHCFVSINNNV